jgi:hypothetical protein
VRVVASSLAKIDATWNFTVFSAKISRAAICLFDRPRASMSRTSRSRGVSVAGASSSGRWRAVKTM